MAFSLTTADRHAVFSRQRVDVFAENEVASTESARQQKDATDLVIQPPADEEETCLLRGTNLIRRLTPLECERLQGFPDGWANIPGASDSVRYKALGNSVAIPCVEYVMRGIAIVLRSERRRRVWIVISIRTKQQRRNLNESGAAAVYLVSCSMLSKRSSSKNCRRVIPSPSQSFYSSGIDSTVIAL